MDKYILDAEGNAVPTDNLMEWGAWFETADRKIARDKLKIGDETVTVSTVFLGLDHGFGRGGPVLFETLVFGGPHDQDERRYSTRQEALAGHAEFLAKHLPLAPHGASTDLPKD